MPPRVCMRVTASAMALTASRAAVSKTVRTASILRVHARDRARIPSNLQSRNLHSTAYRRHRDDLNVTATTRTVLSTTTAATMADTKQDITDVLNAVISDLEAEANLKKAIREAIEPLEAVSRSAGSILNRAMGATAEELHGIAEQALAKLGEAASAWPGVSELIPANEYYKYNFTSSTILKALTQHVALAWFLLHDELASMKRVEETIGIKPEWADRIQLVPEDYLQGVIGMINELARLSTNAVTVQNFTLPLQISEFVKDLFASFSILNFRNDALRRKFDSIKYDLKRCEDVVYDLALRGLIGTTAEAGSKPTPEAESKTTPEAASPTIGSVAKVQPEAERANKADDPNTRAQHAHLISLVKGMIPPLSPLLHKGQAGRIGVLGGSGDYTGAPFFSSLGSLRVGADIAHVICEPKAGAVIKTYSPDLIVHAILDKSRSDDDIRAELKGIMSRLHVLVIGPGLGRDDHMQTCARIALSLAKEQDGMGVVVDADGLFLVANDPTVVMDWPGVPRVVLTPNVMEFSRLCEKMNIPPDAPSKDLCPQLARALQNLTIIQKGATDIISNGLPVPPELIAKGGGKLDVLEDVIEGGLKRAGGQGDLLSGSTAVLLAWGTEWVKGSYKITGQKPASPEIAKHITLLAAYGASSFTRTCSRRTFEKHGRSMQTEDMLANIGEVFEEVFGKQH